MVVIMQTGTLVPVCKFGDKLVNEKILKFLKKVYTNCKLCGIIQIQLLLVRWLIDIGPLNYTIDLREVVLL